MARARRHYGSIQSKPGRPGFYVRFTYAGHRIRRYAGPTRAAARLVLHKVEESAGRGERLSDMLAGVFGDGRLDRPTFRQAARGYLESAQLDLKASTLRDYAVRLVVANRAPWAGWPIDEIRRRDVLQWLEKLRAGGIKAATLNRYQSAVSRVFEWARIRDHIESNPARRVWERRPSEKGSERRVFLTLKQVRQLLAAAPEEFAPVLTIACFAGLRRGEILLLQWRDIDLRARELRLRAETTKDSEERVVPMARAVHRALADIHVQRTQADARAPVFARRDGRAWSKKMVEGRWNKTLAAAESLGALRDELRFHDCRHVFAVLLINAGEPLEVISEMLGHSSISVTAHWYAHLLPDRKQKAVRALRRFGV